MVGKLALKFKMDRVAMGDSIEPSGIQIQWEMEENIGNGKP